MKSKPLHSHTHLQAAQADTQAKPKEPIFAETPNEYFALKQGNFT
jgi:hypothetical protein